MIYWILLIYWQFKRQQFLPTQVLIPLTSQIHSRIYYLGPTIPFKLLESNHDFKSK